MPAAPKKEWNLRGRLGVSKSCRYLLDFINTMAHF